VQIYLAAPLFSEAERHWLDGLAARLRNEGFVCFVPHEHFDEVAELIPEEIYRVDGAGLRSSNVLSHGSTGRRSTTAPPRRSGPSPSSCEAATLGTSVSSGS
jgi:hypothetical protein